MLWCNPYVTEDKITLSVWINTLPTLISYFSDDFLKIKTNLRLPIFWINKIHCEITISIITSFCISIFLQFFWIDHMWLSRYFKKKMRKERKEKEKKTESLKFNLATWSKRRGNIYRETLGQTGTLTLAHVPPHSCTALHRVCARCAT